MMSSSGKVLADYWRRKIKITSRSGGSLSHVGCIGWRERETSDMPEQSWSSHRWVHLRERGAVSVEIAALLPVIVLVACAATGIWRIWWSGQQLEGSAAAAVRAASFAGTVEAAESLARTVVAADMATAQVHCDNLTVNAQMGAITAQPGVSAQLQIDVSCRVKLNDLLVPGLPGALTLQTHAVEVVDTFVRRTR
ncbi:MAG: hypothetical protein LBJ43_01870 [Propionibacteriaceae bacterium]|nr:hypothetical protein [Propionibacteriaceae bacterium]